VTLGEVSEFNYQARDQYSLFGYLTRPPAAAQKNLPLVVLPHGGLTRETIKDSTGWRSPGVAGYAVFQPQFRGSSGSARHTPKRDGINGACACRMT
jgi:dipeptidyl aminopeptidase/acylaminoacyl peptidase